MTIGLGNTDSSTGGMTETPPAKATRLQEVEIKTMASAECVLYRPITENQLCATDVSEGTCNGDSGGPLYDAINGVLVGVTSSGPQRKYHN